MQSNPHSIDLRFPRLVYRSGHLRMGGSNPTGVSIAATSRSLTFGDSPWTPVMGEIHFTRRPRAAWQDDLLKMKAGGVQIAATYLFWNYHEEIEGRFDWSGNRDLRAFVELCAEVGLYAYPRIGPWAHGEVRLGGFPDWLLERCGSAVRCDSQPYLGYAKILYTEIAAQLAGLLWKDGGPVIGIQVENELANNPEHLVTLKQLARAVGLDVPLYTVTGWGPAQIPTDELIPVFGGYPDAPWDRQSEEWARASRKHYLFSPIRDDNAIGADLRRQPAAPDLAYLERYPYGTCEIGGGVQVTYHRRPWITPADVAAVPFCKVGAGANMLGYYMYQGGTNAIGALSSLQESQASGYPNDLPTRSYDFQAPLGEYGQVREHYHSLRTLHLFLADFGSSLAVLPATFPPAPAAGLKDRDSLRWTARSDGQRGFLFVNNYQRIEALPAHQAVQFELRLRSETLTFPASPVTIPSGSRLLWPFNLDLGALTLSYASANLICRLDGLDQACYVFSAVEGIAPEFAFSTAEFDSASGASFTQCDRPTCVTLAGLQPGPGCRISLRSRTGSSVSILILNAQDANRLWKMDLWGAARLVLSTAALLPDGDSLRMRASQTADFSASIYPAPPFPLESQTGLLQPTAEGIFTRWQAAPPSANLEVRASMIQPAKFAPPVQLGSAGVALAPSDEAYQDAEIWQVEVVGHLPAHPAKAILAVEYSADTARAYLGDELIADDFCYGRAWEIGLPENLPPRLELRFLPLRKDAPIYIPPEQLPEFDVNGQALTVRKISARVEHETCLRPFQPS